MISKRLLSLICLSAFVLAMARCAPNAPVAKEGAAVANYTRVDFRETETEASWIFNDLLAGLRSKENYVVEGQFLKDKGSWTLHSHFNGFGAGFGVADGVQIKATRNGAELTFAISTPRFPPRIVTLEQPFQNDLGDFRYRIEVHNGTVDGARIFIWKDWQSFQGEIVAQRTPIMAGNAEFDSRKGGGFFLSSGRGVRWGLQFENVKVIRVSREAPYAP